MEKVKVLFAPLNWGLGHASRTTTVIHDYLNQSHYHVVIAADGEAFTFLKQEFPQIEIFRLTDVKVRYFKGHLFSLGLFIIALKIVYRNWKEHLQLTRLIEQESINVVISDNRYGLWNRNVKNILITHQLSIFPPKYFHWIAPFLRKIIKKKISHFDEIWIPDYDRSPGLSGELSHGTKIHPNVQYIGPISRYKIQPTNQKQNIVALISGPEPFKSQLLYNLMELRIPITLYGNNLVVKKRNPDVTIIQNATYVQLNQALNEASCVIASGGYTTIMDLHILNKKAILIPTPHQTEQAYLAQNNKENPNFTFLKYDEVEKIPQILRQHNLR